MVGAYQRAAKVVAEDYGGGAIVLVRARRALLVDLHNAQSNRVQGDHGAGVGAVRAAIEVLPGDDHQGAAIGAEGGRVPDPATRCARRHEILVLLLGAGAHIDRAYLTP